MKKFLIEFHTSGQIRIGNIDDLSKKVINFEKGTTILVDELEVFSVIEATHHQGFEITVYQATEVCTLLY